LTLSSDEISAGRSRYRIALPEENLADTRLVLTTGGRTFQRGVTVQILRRGKISRDSEGWQILAREEWRHNDPQSEAEPLILKLAGPLSSKEMTLVIDEGDNQPLPIQSARLELPLYRLRFYYPAGGALTLLYGQDHLSAPQYDLAMLAPSLVGVTSKELTLSNSVSTSTSNSQIETRLFWAALIIAVLAILAILARLLRKSGESGTDSI